MTMTTDLHTLQSINHKLKMAVQLVLPEIRHSIKCGDGRFTGNQVASLEAALASARGEVVQEAAE